MLWIIQITTKWHLPNSPHYILAESLNPQHNNMFSFLFHPISLMLLFFSLNYINKILIVNYKQQLNIAHHSPN